MGLKRAARKNRVPSSSSPSSQVLEEAAAEKPISPTIPQQAQPSDSDPEETHLGPPTAYGPTKSVAASKPKKATSAKRPMQESEKNAKKKTKKAMVVVEEEDKNESVEEQQVQEAEAEKAVKTNPSVEKPITPSESQQPQLSDSDLGSDSEEIPLGSVAASKPKKATSAKRPMQEFEKNAKKKTKKAVVVVEEEDKNESVEEQQVQEAEAEKAEKTNPSVEKPITPSESQQPQFSDSDLGSDSEEIPLGSVAASKPKKATPDERLMPEFEKNAQQKNKVVRVVEDEEKDESSEDVEEQELQEEEEEEKAEKKKSTGAIMRVWTEEDEVVILKGLVDFQGEKGPDLFPKMGEFHKQIKESLSVDVSDKQFVKIRKLKGKYIAYIAKGEKAVFSRRPHERKCFELSKKIWGGGKEDGGIGENDWKEGALGDGNKKGVDVNGKSIRSKKPRKTVEKDGKGKVKVGWEKESEGGGMRDVEVDEVGIFWVVHPHLKESLEMDTEMGLPSDLLRENPTRRYLKENMSTIGGKKARELEKEWKNLRAEEVALAMKRGKLMNKQTKLVLDATNASKE